PRNQACVAPGFVVPRVVVRLEAVSNDLGAGWEPNRSRTGIVVAQDNRRGVAHELREGRLDVLQIAIDVEVIGFDVGDHRDGWREREERPIILVGFDHEQLVGTVTQIAVPLGDTSAGDSRRFEAGCGERRRRHHSGGGFPVRPRDTHHTTVGDGATQCLRPAGDGYSELSRAHELGVILGHGRRHDQLASAVDVLRTVPRCDLDTKGPEILAPAGIGVAAGNRDAAPRQKLGERAHPGAGDSDEMDRAWIVAIDRRHGAGWQSASRQRRGRRWPMRSRMWRAMSAAAVGLARSNDFARIAASFSGLDSSSPTADESLSTLRSDCRIISAAPAPERAFALAVW